MLKFRSFCWPGKQVSEEKVWCSAPYCWIINSVCLYSSLVNPSPQFAPLYKRLWSQINGQNNFFFFFGGGGGGGKKMCRIFRNLDPVISKSNTVTPNSYCTNVFMHGTTCNTHTQIRKLCCANRFRACPLEKRPIPSSSSVGYAAIFCPGQVSEVSRWPQSTVSPYSQLFHVPYLDARALPWLAFAWMSSAVLYWVVSRFFATAVERKFFSQFNRKPRSDHCSRQLFIQGHGSRTV